MSEDKSGVYDDDMDDDKKDLPPVDIIFVKRQRAGYKSVITKRRNEARALMLTENDPKVIKSLLPGMRDAWLKFEQCHQYLCSLLTSQEELSEAERYYIEELDAEEGIMTRITNWVQTAEMSRAYDDLGESVSQTSVKTKRSSKSGSSNRLKQLEATANRRALEARYMVLEEQQTLIEQRMKLQQQEQRLEVKASIAEAKAREDVYTQSCVSAYNTAPKKRVSVVKEELTPTSEFKFDPTVPEWNDKQVIPPMCASVQYHVDPTCTTIPTIPDDNVLGTVSNEYVSPNKAGRDEVKHASASNSLNTHDNLLLNMIDLVTKQQQQASAALTLPKPVLTSYDGDPLEYCNFIRAFENLIETRTVDPSSRLQYLIQFTSGDVKELMRSFLAMDPPDKGYCEAKRQLKTRYGQEYRIATAYVDKITKGHQIKSEDRSSLSKLSVLLTSCKNTLASVGYQSKIENPDSLRLVINRLPFDMRKRWRARADRISEEEHREIKFSDIVYFVEKEARMASHPIFGDVSGSVTQQPNVRHVTARRHTQSASFATHAGYKGTQGTESQYHNNNSSVQPVFSKQDTYNSSVQPVFRKQDTHNSFVQPVLRKCVICDMATHTLDTCVKFKNMSLPTRVEFVQHKGLCFNCLIPRHRAKDCRKWSRCSQCNRKHSTLLHQESEQRNQKEENKNDVQVGAIVAGTDNKTVSLTNESIGMSIVPVKVKAKTGELVPTLAFIDNGSNMTIATLELQNQLGIEGKKMCINLSTLDNKNRRVEDKMFDLQIYDYDEEQEDYLQLSNVFCRPTLPVSKDDMPTQADVDRWPYLKGIHIHDVDLPIGLLIGNNNSSIIEPLEIVSSQQGGPFAVKTVLGWTLNGPLGRMPTTKNNVVNFIRGDTALSQQFQDFCNREFNESLADVSTKMSRNDAKAMKIMEDSIHLTDDNHYEMDLPLMCDSLYLPDNKSLAEHRLRILKKRLVNDEDLHQRYATFMNNLFIKGYAEVIPEYVACKEGMVWYLPHHSVVHPQKPEKVRVVFDCSAKYQNISLNDILLQGPDFNNSLLGVLLRFRKEPIAIKSDVEAMFYQVKVSSHHCDLLRFLWWKDGNLDSEPQVCRMKVHIFGATSSPSCCSYALRRAAEDNKNKFDDFTTSTVQDNFYVDDCLTCVSDVETAVRLVSQLSQMLAKGGFHLTKWTSNSLQLLENIPAEERATGLHNMDMSNLGGVYVERALGVQWNISSDQFQFSITVKERPATRRGILSVMTSIYDPLGFLAPILLPVKCILQDLCRLDLKWDDPIPEESLHKWKIWLFSLPKLEKLCINRSLMDDRDKIVSCELHHFSDAAETGYASVSYLRLIDADNKIHCVFLTGKSRVAPLKFVSIPRLELSAATLSVRLDNMLRRELGLHITRSLFWTDSTTVLKFIHNKDKRFLTFVANRVAVIHDGSEVSSWKYVDTGSNPADEASRGISVESLIKRPRWLTGPGFLSHTEDHWPKQPTCVEPVPLDDPEVKRACNVVTMTVDPDYDANASVLTHIIERSSNWYKLLRSISWILRYKNCLQRAVKRRIAGTPLNYTRRAAIKSLDVSDIQVAETCIVKHAQRSKYEEEIKTLTRNNQQGNSGRRTAKVKRSSSLFKLDPFIEDGLLRVGGRLQNAEIDQNSKHPSILPHDHDVTKLIINHYHKLAGHSGRNHVLSLLRQQYWIIHGNAAVRKVLSDCFDCRRRQAQFGNQKMADLPPDRVECNQPPFTSVGIDCFGPFFVKRGRSQAKRYGCIFTCLSTRSVHIEVIPSLDTDSFINCLRRFIARRGQPSLVRSDNAGNFVSGNKEIKNAISQWNQTRIHDFCLQHGTKWLFNPPYGSHHGGAWERCIRTARKILNALVKNQVLDDDQLITLMAEVEAVMNSRPLTAISDDPRDPCALTPNHLLLLRSGPTLPPGIFTKHDVYSKRRWRHVQYMADQFWIRFIREYLPLLQSRQKWNHPKRNFRVGDIVLVANENNPRCSWPLGRIVDVTPGSDGYIRRVKVFTRGTTLDRPIDKCVLLEATELGT